MRINLAQICPKIDFGVEILKIKTQIWNQLYLDTMCANFQVKVTNLTSFSANLPKNEFWSHNFKNLRPYSESATLRYHMFQFSGKRTALDFSEQISLKTHLGSEIQKTHVGIRISTPEISCVRNFQQNGQLEVFSSNLPEKRI